jgi:tetratricopeptide (TPR) repeat protein
MISVNPSLFRRFSTTAVVVTLLLLGGCGAKGPKSLERGKELMKQKDYTRALLELRNAYRHLPKDAEVSYQLGLAYLATADLNNGVRHLRYATQLNPNHAEAQTKLAELMAMNGGNEVVQEAERRARLALAASANNYDAVATLAFAELRLGKVDDAEKRLEDVLARSPQALKASIVLANLRLTQKKPQEAEEILKKAVESNPGMWEAWFAQARLYQALKKPAEAEASLARVIQVDPTNELALQNLIALQLATNRTQEAEATIQKLAALPSKKYVSAHAVFAFEQGRKDEAVRELINLYAANPKNRTVRTQLVAAHLATNNQGSAEKILNDALNDNPKDVDALLQRGRLHLIAGRLDKLDADLTQVLRFKGDSGEAHYLMARLHRARQNPGNEERELYEALKLAPNLLAARLDLAQHLITKGGGRAALDLLDAAPADQKKLLPTLVQRNWALWAQNELAQLKLGIQAGYQFGRPPEILLQEALVLLREKKFVPARQLLREAAKSKPEDMRIVQTLGESFVLENKSNMAEAVKEVQAIASQHPKSARLQQVQGNWLIAAGRVEEARKSFEAAKAADPTSKSDSFALAQVDVARGDVESARKNMTEVLEKDSRDPGATLLLAMIDEKAGLAAQATAGYRKVIEFDPSNAVAFNNLAYRLISDNNKSEEAIRFAQKAKELAPSSAAVDDTLGWIFYNKGLYSSAVRHLESATSTPTNATAVRLYHLAMAYQKAGVLNKAHDAYSKALKVNPNLPEAAQAKTVLGIR